MPPRTEIKVTPQEYLHLERLADARSEYFDGEILRMPGVTRDHSRITRNLVVELSNQLADRPCEVFFCDMRVKVSVSGSYTYPDVAVLCGEPLFEDAYVDSLVNPQLIIEVLSESTEKHDRGRKLQQYRSIESLQEYVLVSQTECRVERYTRQHGSEEWSYIDTTDPQAVIDFRSIACRVPVGRIYDGITFEEQ